LNNWNKALLSETATLADAIKNLDDSNLQIVLVISSEGLLVGTLTDGDVRRGLLHGLEMGSSIDSIIYTTPLVVPLTVGRETALQIMQVNKIHQLPIIDEQQNVVGLHLWDELSLPSQRPNIMVIMAGGQGTRLRPHTENCPKPLLPVGNKPMLEHIIERAKRDGFYHFVISIHYLGHMIEEHFGDGSKWQVKIDYLREKSPLGTAGAISLLENKPTLPFLVTNGDVLTDIRYGELLDFHCYHNSVATMAVRLHEWQHPYGVVNTKGVDIESFEEKPITRTNINTGIYILDPAALDSLNNNEYCDMPTLFTSLQEKGYRTIVYPMYEPWVDIGRMEDYEAANNITKI
jgi:dTDP-glucose pyrophosphorylase